jgi:hypothetical protein
MKPKTLYVTVEMCPWFRRILFAAIDLVAAVEEADDVLVTDEILATASRLRDELSGKEATA